MIPLQNADPKDSHAGEPTAPIPSTPTVPEQAASGLSTAVFALAVSRRDAVVAALNREKGISLGQIACLHGTSVATLKRWIRAFQLGDGSLLSLVSSEAVSPGSRTCISAGTEQVVSEVIEVGYLGADRWPRRRVIHEIVTRCKCQGVKPPSEATIYRRLDQLDIQETTKAREGKRAWKTRFKQLVGEAAKGTFPLDFAQLDHFLSDVVTLTEDRIKVLGRAWVTMVIDTYSRCVLALVIGIKKPGLAEVCAALVQAVLPKDKLLEELGIEAAWPCQGLLAMAQMDNAWELRSTSLVESFNRYGMDIQWRLVAQPETGPHVERLVGTIQEELSQLPGRTYSSPSARGDYDSHKHAVMTLSEYRLYLFKYILTVYHNRPHKGLDGFTPLEKWTEGIEGSDTTPGIGATRLPADIRRFYLDFLRHRRRTIDRHGIQLFNTFYQSEVLQGLVGYRDPRHPNESFRFEVRYDEQDLSRVFVLDPRTNEFLEVPYRNIALPPMTMAQVTERNHTVRERFRSKSNSDQLLQARSELHDFVDTCSHQTHTNQLCRKNQQKGSSASCAGIDKSQTEASDGSNATPCADLMTSKNSCGDEPSFQTNNWATVVQILEVEDV